MSSRASCSPTKHLSAHFPRHACVTLISCRSVSARCPSSVPGKRPENGSFLLPEDRCCSSVTPPPGQMSPCVGLRLLLRPLLLQPTPPGVAGRSAPSAGKRPRPRPLPSAVIHVSVALAHRRTVLSVLAFKKIFTHLSHLPLCCCRCKQKRNNFLSLTLVKLA